MSLAEISQHSESIPSPETTNKLSAVFGKYLPSRILTNEEIESWGVLTPNGNILTADNIQKRTGIARRYVAGEKETPLSMGLEAAQEAYRNRPGKIDAIIVTTNFPTGQNLSEEIAKEFGISGFNMDVHAACSGFGYSLNYIKNHEEEFLGKRILFIATERISPYLQDLRNNVNDDGGLRDPTLHQTIFSDGAVALLTEYGKDMRVIFSSVHTFPQDANDAIKMPFDITLLREPYLYFPAPYTESGVIEQDGKRVYVLMRAAIPRLIKEEILKANLKPSDFKNLDPHQGSGHMIKGIGERLNGYSVYRDFEEGNFSSASIPKALNAAIEKGEIKKGDIVVLAGFGAGMFASITVVRLN